MDTDTEGEFLFVGEKNGSIKIWCMGANGEQDVQKQVIEINTGLNGLSFESKYFSVISLATQKGITIREIQTNNNIFNFQPAPFVSCISLAWDASSKLIFYNYLLYL
jgi:hypothetical protein